MRGVRARRGAVLIVVMGVLFVLALLATTFATMQSLEREVSRNYLNGVRAKLVARAGVDVAYARLMEGLNAGQLSSPAFIKALRYYGTDIMETGTNPTLLNATLEECSNPSLAVETTTLGNAFAPVETPQNPTNPTFTPRNIWVKLPTGTMAVGFSGVMENGTFGVNGDFFALNIRDASGMIYVNDGANESATYGSVSRNLRRVLNRLGQIPSITIPTLGDQILNNRPAGGYKSKRELQTVLGTTNYQKVANFVTCQAWVDGNVPNPVPLSADPSVLAYYNYWYTSGTTTGTNFLFRGTPPRFRYGWRKDYQNTIVPGSPNIQMAGSVTPTPPGLPGLAPATGFTNAIYGMDELFPRWVEMTSRAPVNLNSAPKEVLQALLSDIHGFWVQERRRDNPPAYFDRMTANFNNQGHSYDTTTGDEGDQFGFVVTSQPVLGPTVPPGPNTSSWIADEIIACRNGSTSPNTGDNYATMPFGGPFRSWRQFDMFLDYLVDREIIVDTRVDIGSHPFACYAPSAANRTGGNGLGLANGFQANIYKRLASQAIADAIKSNFNPNLHLNEANPDENMNRMIDKTDLIVMSTEGCFAPTGFYEIESLGRVVRPPAGTPPNSLNSTVATPCELMAEFKVQAVIKLFDAIRFTSQRDFYGYGSTSAPLPTENTSPTGVNYWPMGLSMGGGVVGQRTSAPNTNNALSMEVGPEPDFGTAPERTRWGGYIAWPTNFGDIQTPKPLGTMPGSDDPNELSCPDGANAFANANNVCMHAHWSRSDYLSQHYEAGANPNYRRNLNRFSGLIATEHNTTYPDYNEPLAGPYDPFRPAPANGIGHPPGSPNWHRLARDWRGPTATGPGSTTIVPNIGGETGSPLDLRIDGIYLERHSTLAYWMSNQTVTGVDYLTAGSKEYRLMFGYWMKPKYYPEMSGKPRMYWNWKKIDVRGDTFEIFGRPEQDDSFPMTHYFCPSQNPTYENYEPTSHLWNGYFAEFYPIRVASMIVLHWEGFAAYPGSYCPTQCEAGGWASASTPCLNHHVHGNSLSTTLPAYVGCAFPGQTRRWTKFTYSRIPYYELKNPLSAGRWMHFISAQDGSQTHDVGAFGARPMRRLFINGIEHGTSMNRHLMKFGGNGGDVETTWPHYHLDHGRHVTGNNGVIGPGYYQSAAGQHNCCTNQNAMYDAGVSNILRIGESDQYSPSGSGLTGSYPTPGQPTWTNWAPDATMDEYYMVVKTVQAISSGADVADMLDLYRQGRYHIPRDAGEGLYVSPRFNLPVGSSVRALPPPSTIAPPSGTSPVPPPAGAAAVTQPKIIGMNWTWYGETSVLMTLSPELTNYLTPVVVDYSTQESATGPVNLVPRLECSIQVDGTWYGPYVNDFFSSVRNPVTGAPVNVITPTDLRFRFKFGWWGSTGMGPNLTSYVHATPYIDDITIYYDRGDSGFVDYHMS